MRNGQFKRSLSLFLALVMILGNLPVNALATEGEEGASICEHSYEAVAVDATCSQGGYTTHTCGLCGDTYKDNETQPLGHIWDEGAVTTEPSCDEAGVKTYACTVCGDTREEPVDTLPHSWDEGTVTTEPSCDEAGVKTYACTVCGDTREEPVDTLPHSWDGGAVTTEPSCSAAGVKTYACTVCGETKEESVEALAHSWSGWTVTQEATVEAAGKETRTCGTCGATEERAIDKLEPEEDPAVIAVQAMMDALATTVVSDEEAEELEADIRAVDDAIDELYTEQSDQLDYTNYVAAMQALEDYWDVVYSLETMADFTDEWSTGADGLSNGVLTIYSGNAKYSGLTKLVPLLASISASDRNYKLVVNGEKVWECAINQVYNASYPDYTFQHDVTYDVYIEDNTGSKFNPNYEWQQSGSFTVSLYDKLTKTIQKGDATSTQYAKITRGTGTVAVDVPDYSSDHYHLVSIDGHTTPAVSGSQYTVTMDGDTTVTMVYALDTYTISWDTDGDGEVDNTDTVSHGTVPTAPAHTGEGNFAGWKSSADNQVYSNIPAATGAVTYTATYTPDEMKEVTVVVNNATVKTFRVNVTKNETVAASGNTVTHTKHDNTTETYTYHDTNTDNVIFVEWRAESNVFTAVFQADTNNNSKNDATETITISAHSNATVTVDGAEVSQSGTTVLYDSTVGATVVITPASGYYVDAKLDGAEAGTYENKNIGTLLNGDYRNLCTVSVPAGAETSHNVVVTSTLYTWNLPAEEVTIGTSGYLFSGFSVEKDDVLTAIYGEGEYTSSAYRGIVDEGWDSFTVKLDEPFTYKITKLATDKYPAVSDTVEVTVKDNRQPAIISGLANGDKLNADTEDKFKKAVEDAVSVKDYKDGAVSDVSYGYEKQADGTYTVTVTADNNLGGGHNWTRNTATYTGIQWIVNQYGVTFKDYDGKVLLAEKKYPYGTPSNDVETPSNNPVRTGYTFTGWDKDVAEVTADVTYTATYKVNQYTITWNINNVMYSQSEFDYGAEVTKPAYTEPEGHTFTEWQIPETMTAEDLVLNATQIPNKYDVRWVYQTANGERTVTKSEDYGTEIVVPEEIPVQYTAGNVTYTRTGWVTADSKPLTDGMKVPVDGIAFTATYTTETAWTVRFDSAGGSTVQNVTVIVSEGETKTVTKPADPTRDGYRFDGWYLDEEEYDFSTPVTANITLTAHWIQQVTVTFDVDGDTTKIESQTFDVNTTATVPTAPTKDKAIFGYWKLGENQYDFSTPVTGDITLTAHWLADINSNGVPDTEETITITVEQKNDLDRVEYTGLMEVEQGKYVFDSTKTEQVAITATPVVNDGISVTCVAGITGVNGEGKYGDGYVYTFAFTPANGQEVLVTFQDVGFIYQDDAYVVYYDGMPDMDLKAIYGNIVASPVYDDAKEVTITYKAREATTEYVSIDSLDFGSLVGADLLKEGLKRIWPKGIPINLPDLWLEFNAEVQETVSLDQAVAQNLKADLLGEALKAYISSGLDIDAVREVLEAPLAAVAEAVKYNGAHTFGENKTTDETVTEEIKITYLSPDRYIEGETTVTLKDPRAVSQIMGQDVTLAYRDYTDEDLFAAIGAYAADENGTMVSEEVYSLDIQAPYTLEGRSVSTTAITVKFKGNDAYKPSEKTFNVTITKAPLSLDLPNVMVNYGENYDTTPTFTLGNKYGQKEEVNGSLIRFIVGLDVAALDANADGVTGLEGKVQLLLTDDLKEKLSKLGINLEDGVEMSLSDLTKTLELINDDSLAMLKQALDAISGITESGDITITLGGKYPENIGAYLYGAVTTSPNYETAFDVAYIVIRPNAQQVYLDWDYTDSNGIFTAELLKQVDLGAAAYNDEAFASKNEEATQLVRNLFFGINAEGKLVTKLVDRGTKPETIEKTLGYGAYTQIAFLAEISNEMYYAAPIVRAFAMVPSVLKLDIIVDGAAVADLYTTEFDNQSVDVEAIVSTQTEDPYEVTYHYYGIQGNTQTYDSDTAPTHAGAYLITASAVVKNGDGLVTAVGLDTATLVILPTESSVVMKELEKAEFDGKSINVSEAMEISAASKLAGLKPDTTVITAGIATDGTFSENSWEAVNGTVNVDFPKWVDELIAQYAPSIKEGITVAQLKEKLLNKLPDITSWLEELGLNEEQVSSAKDVIASVGSVLEKMPGDVHLSFQDNYMVNAVGAYAVVAVVTDSDHIPAVDAGLLVIAPAVKQVYLDWNHHDENGIWSRELLKVTNLYASAFEEKTFATKDEAATAMITHKFIGLDSNGELKIYNDPSTLENGAYVELAYIALEADSQMTISDIIARSILIVPNDAGLQIVDENGAAQNKFEFVFDNEAVVLYVQQNGEIVNRDIRYIGLQTNGVKYDSTEAPKNAGIYAAYTVLIQEDLVGMDVALVTIAPAESTIAVTGDTVTYDGESHMATVEVKSPDSTVTEPDYTLISGNVHVSGDIESVGVDAFHGSVNIDFPRWLDTLMKEKNVEAYNEGVSSAYLVEFITAYRSKLVGLIPVEELTRLGIEDADIAAAVEKLNGYIDELLTILDKLPKDVKITFLNKEDLEYTEPGYYFFYGIVTDSDHMPASDTGLLVIEKMDMVFGAWHEVVPYDGQEHAVYVPNDEHGPVTVDYVTMIVDRENNHVNFLLDADLMYVVDTAERLLNVTIPDQISIADLRARLQEHGLDIDDFADALIQVLDAVMEGMEIPETPADYAQSTYRDLVNIKEILSKLPETGTITINGSKPVNVGRYEFYILAFSEYYKTQDASAVLFIEPITVRVNDEENGKIYGNADPELTAQVTYYSYIGREDPYYQAENYPEGHIRGGKFDAFSTSTDASFSNIVYYEKAVETMPEAISLSYDVTRAPGENAGTYAMQVENAKLTASDNYALEVVEDDTVFTIHPKMLTEADITLGGNLVYNGAAQTLEVTAPAGAVVQGNRQTNAGTYQLTVTMPDGCNYAGSVVLEWKIAPKPVTIVVKDVMVEEGQAPAYESEAEGVIAGDDLGLRYVCNHGGKPGSYEINAYVTNTNYEAVVTPGTLTINARDEETGFRIYFQDMPGDKAAETIKPNQTVEIDGVEYPLDEKGELWVTEEVWNSLLTSTKLLTTYTYNQPAGADPHTVYPTAMYVWVLTRTEAQGEVKIIAERIKPLDNYLMYEGTSIRINFVDNAIRFFTSVTPEGFHGLKNGTLLNGTVLDGGRLSVIGTRAKGYNGDSNLTVGNSIGDVVYGTYEGHSATADGKANADGLRKFGDGARVMTGESCYLFTGALENIPLRRDDLNKEIMFRPFMIIEHDGEQIILYGGKYQRGVAYVALQNKDFMAGTDYNAYIQDIISVSGIAGE